MEAIQTRAGGAADTLAGLLAADGSADHPYVRRLLAPRSPRRDLADAVHALCAVHGGHPGLVDEALARCVQPDACGWLGEVARGFAEERSGIALLAAAVGPLPSTPGQAESEAALSGVRHAACMLARSDRGGCATGAAAALVGDWVVVRGIMQRAADDFTVALPGSTLPPASETATALDTLCGQPAAERAMGFGARQLLAQHRGLWDLLEARAAARG